jgi:hypothetical protein
MTIFLSSLLLALAAPAPDRELPIEPRNELERRVLAPFEQSTELTEQWLATFGHDRTRLEAELAGAGFGLGPSQGGKCRWFVYLRPVKLDGFERHATIGLCPDKPFVLILKGLTPSAEPPGPGAPVIRFGAGTPETPPRKPQ